MAFSLGNSIISSKIREEMYLKHLRQVQKINNRQPDYLKKELKQYNSITELHRHNKIKSAKFKSGEKQKNIEQKNKQIKKKIQEIGSRSDQKNRYANSVGQTLKSDFHYSYRKKQKQLMEKGSVMLKNSYERQHSSMLPEIRKKDVNKSSRHSNNQTDIS